MEVSWDSVPFPLLLAGENGIILALNSCAASELEVDGPCLVGQPLEACLGQLPAGPLQAFEAAWPGSSERKLRLHCRTSTFAGQPCRAITWLEIPSEVGRPAPLKAPSGSRPACVLVAEDEDSIRDICRRVLSDAGYRVLVAADGQAAIDILEEQGAEIDLVLADVVMPIAGGEAIYDHLQRAELEIPIIYASGYTLRNASADFLAQQGATLLRKPYSLAQLLAAVREALPERALPLL